MLREIFSFKNSLLNYDGSFGVILMAWKQKNLWSTGWDKINVSRNFPDNWLLRSSDLIPLAYWAFVISKNYTNQHCRSIMWQNESQLIYEPTSKWWTQNILKLVNFKIKYRSLWTKKISILKKFKRNKFGKPIRSCSILGNFDMF